LRLSRWTLVAAFLINGTMLVSTIPHGGHYLIDLVGGAIALCAILVVRLPLGRSCRSAGSEQEGIARQRLSKRFRNSAA